MAAITAATAQMPFLTLNEPPFCSTVSMLGAVQLYSEYRKCAIMKGGMLR